MYARLIQMQASPSDFDGIMSVLKERVAPAVRQLPGCKMDYFAGDRDQGRLVSFVLFEDKAGTEAAEALFQQMAPQVKNLGLRFDSVENLEVLIGS